MAGKGDPVAETVATGALMTLMSALIIGVIGLMEWSSGGGVLALALCGVAALGFVASLVYFVMDGRRADEAAAAELPFPSWLRAEPESAR